LASASKTQFAQRQQAERLLRLSRAGVEHAAAGRTIQAVEAFESILRVCPTHGEAWFHCGMVKLSAGQRDDAYGCFAQAVILTPLYETAQKKLAAVASDLGRTPHVLTAWIVDPRPTLKATLAAKLNPLFCRAAAIDFAGVDGDEADLRRNIMQRSGSYDLATQLGRLLARARRFVEAEAFLRYALALAPWHDEAIVWLCIVLDNTGRSDTVIDEARRALAAGATADRLYAVILWHAIAVCDWADYDRLLRRVRKMLERSPASIEPLAAFYYTEEPGLLLECAKSYGESAAAGARPMSPQSPYARNRLTLGYVSAEFGAHAGAQLIVEVLELHDRARFKVNGYSLLRDELSPLSSRIRAACDIFVELVDAPPEALAQRLREDKVDILIDCTGYAKNSQPGVIAHRAAPIQINYLAFPGTLGTAAVDYIIADAVVTPKEHARFYTEALVHLPDTYQPNDRKKPGIALNKPRAAYGLPMDGVVFCAFNSPRKITPVVYACWMRILRRVPRSVLWVLSSDPRTNENLTHETLRAGVARERIVFAPRLPHAEHLARYAAADLFLDTLPYNAHTTASDALWVGCPVLTVLGRVFPGRVAASLLHAAGLPELVAHSIEEYEEMAVRVGGDANYRSHLKVKLRQRRESCALFDSPRYVRHMEWAYDEMWRRFVANEKPTLMEVPPL